MSICIRYTKDHSLAEDALQETFINVFKYINTFSGSGSFEGWLKKIAINSSLSFQKKIKNDSSFVEIDESFSSYAEIPDIYGSLNREEILSLLNELPHSQYTIFNLRIVEEFTHKEISEMLNISERTSRSTLSRARARLIDIMKREEKLELERINKFSVNDD